MRFEVLTGVKISKSVFWFVTPCGLICRQPPTFQRNRIIPSSGDIINLSSHSAKRDEHWFYRHQSHERIAIQISWRSWEDL
jgi:hypothetical protein